MNETLRSSPPWLAASTSDSHFIFPKHCTPPVARTTTPNATLLQSNAHNMATGDKVSVILPQLFVSFLATPPRLNPAYDKVSRESESAILEFCKLDERVTKIIRKGDFSRFVAIAAPDAEEAKFRTYCDWCNWVFPYDDLFDNGYLRSDAPAAQAKMKALFYGMEPHGSARTTGQCNLVRFHNIIWERIRSSASVGVQQRFARTMRQFCDAVLKQVITLAADETPTVEEMLAIRRQSAGVGPLFPLYEYANNLDLPDDFFDHAAIQELQELGMDCALL